MQEGDRILSLMMAAKRLGASDLLLVAGAPPTVYVNTRMEVLASEPRDSSRAGTPTPKTSASAVGWHGSTKGEQNVGPAFQPVRAADPCQKGSSHGLASPRGSVELRDDANPGHPTLNTDSSSLPAPPGPDAPLAGEPLSAAKLNDLVMAFLNAPQRERLNRHRDLDFSIGHAQVGRCRINIHYQRRSLAMAVRFINSEIPELEELHLPTRLADLAELPRGLVLVTGPTGSGKSTTLAALLERINRRRRVHVITLEDPIEFAFTNRRSIIEQREIGEDSPSFAEALRHVVRQKPDVILVGEMRDLPTIAAALTAAETGHLVLASLHTNTAAQTIERVVDVFDSRRQQQVRVQLGATLRAVVCQALFPNERDGGMVPAIELLAMTPAIARAIRDNNTHLIDGMIETGGQQGMQTLDAAIARLVSEGLISRDTAMSKAADPERLERLLGRPPAERSPESRVPSPESRVPSPESSVQRPKSKGETRDFGLGTRDLGAGTSKRPWE